jgi:hypothetical protein
MSRSSWKRLAALLSSSNLDVGPGAVPGHRKAGGLCPPAFSRFSRAEFVHGGLPRQYLHMAAT